MHPIAFKLGSFTIHWYGILVAIGFLLAFWTASRRAPRNQISPDQISELGPWLLVGAVIGARTLHVISYWKEEFATRPFTEVFMVQKGGLVFYGGFIGATLAVLIYAGIKKLPRWKLTDVLAPSLPLGHAIGRIGCVMTGCCYGTSCDAPWAFRYPAAHHTQGSPVHPVQIYEALLNLALYFFLAWFYRRKKFDGQVFGLYLIGYALLRTIVEQFRGDYKPIEFIGPLTPGQAVSVAIFAAGVGLLIALRRPVPQS